MRRDFSSGGACCFFGDDTIFSIGRARAREKYYVFWVAPARPYIGNETAVSHTTKKPPSPVAFTAL